MPFCSNCGQYLTIGTEKFCPNCGQDLSKHGVIQTQETQENRGGINISGTHGDVMGVDVSGSGNIIGKNIMVGSGTISVNERQLAKLSDKYAESLKSFSNKLNEQLKSQQVPEDKVKEVNNTINDFAQEVHDIKPGQDLSIIKRSNLKMKLINIAKAVLTILPKTLPAALSAFAPLQPFSQLIGEDTQVLVQAIQKDI